MKKIMVSAALLLALAGAAGCSSNTSSGTATPATSAATTSAATESSAEADAPTINNMDDFFVSALRTEHLTFGDQATMVAAGKAVCSGLSNGKSSDEVEEGMRQASGLDPEDASKVVKWSLTVYCTSEMPHYYGLG